VGLNHLAGIGGFHHQSSGYYTGSGGELSCAVYQDRVRDNITMQTVPQYELPVDVLGFTV
jgi:hypothetical protein